MYRENVDLLTSEPFKFVVENRAVYIHRDLVSRLCKPLDRLINGGFGEGKAREAELEGVDSATFDRFCHWAYAGYYYVPSTQSRVANDAKPDLEIGKAFESASTGIFPSPKASKRSNETALSSLKNSFGKLIFLKPEYDLPLLNACVNDPSEDFTEVFLSHAKLYVFAEEMDVQRLKDLTLHQLHKTLMGFKLFHHNAPEVTKLISYVYANTTRPSSGKEPMRDMLARYCGCKMDVFVTVEYFHAVMSQHEEFVEDFCGEVNNYFKTIQ